MRHSIDVTGMLGAADILDLPLARAYMTSRLAAGMIPSDVLDAMGTVPRHCFLPRHRWRVAYLDLNLRTGDGWLTAPNVVAKALAALPCRDDSRVLEIGTGTGYQTVLLAILNDEVLTIGDPGGPAFEALRRLDSTGLTGIRVVAGHRRIEDFGLENGTFDGIVVNHALRQFPNRLLSLLRPAIGHIVVPIQAADGTQRLVRCTITSGEVMHMIDLGSVVYPVAWWE